MEKKISFRGKDLSMLRYVLLNAETNIVTREELDEFDKQALAFIKEVVSIINLKQ